MSRRESVAGAKDAAKNDVGIPFRRNLLRTILNDLKPANLDSSVAYTSTPLKLLIHNKRFGEQMRNMTIKTLLIIIGLATSGYASAAGGRGNPGPISPYIVKTSVDTKEKTLIITGRNFGASAPTVMLSDQVLEVKRFSDNEVVASLPRQLASATYGITVTTNGARNRVSSNVFNSTLAGHQ